MAHTSPAPPSLMTNHGLVFRTLRQSNRPLTAYQVLDRLRDTSVSAPTTVYRALRRLLRDGLVHRIETLNAYVICSQRNRHGTPAFAICEHCGAVIEFPDKVIDTRLKQWAEDAKFGIGSAGIEIRGECADCRAGQSLDQVGQP